MNERLCPYCNTPMEKGFIEHARGVAAWTPDGRREPLLFPLTTGKSIMIGDPESGPLLGSLVTADFCRKCSKIIIDV